MSIREVNIESKTGRTELVLFSKNQGVVRGIFDQKNKLNNYKMISNEIYACEILSSEGRKYIQNKYSQSKNLNLNLTENKFDLLPFLRQ